MAGLRDQGSLLTVCRPGLQPGDASAAEPAAQSTGATQPPQQTATAQADTPAGTPTAATISNKQQQQQQQQQHGPAAGAQLASAGGAGLRTELSAAGGCVPPWGSQHRSAASCAARSSAGSSGGAAELGRALQQASSCCLGGVLRAAPGVASPAAAVLNRSSGAAKQDSAAMARPSACDTAAWRTVAEPGMAQPEVCTADPAASWQSAGSSCRPPTLLRHATAETPPLQPPSSIRFPSVRAPLQPAAGHGALLLGVPPPAPAAGSRKQGGLLLKAARLGLLQ